MASALHIQMPNYSKPLALLRSKERFSLSSLLSVYSYHLGINDCLMLKEQNSANIIFRRLLAWPISVIIWLRWFTMDLLKWTDKSIIKLIFPLIIAGRKSKNFPIIPRALLFVPWCWQKIFLLCISVHCLKKNSTLFPWRIDFIFPPASFIPFDISAQSQYTGWWKSGWPCDLWTLTVCASDPWFIPSAPSLCSDLPYLKCSCVSCSHPTALFPALLHI